MKKIAILLTTVAISALLHAQSKYETAMQQQIAQLYASATPEAYQQRAQAFERIALAEKKEWLPYYYAAYALVMQSYATQDISEVDPMLDRATAHLQSAAAIAADNSEITTVQAMVLQAQMRVDNTRAMVNGPRAGELMKKAMAQAPANNPRLWLTLAQNTYYTPEAFGGGKKQGVELLQKALDAYEAFAPESVLHPNWGKAYAQQLMGQWKAAK